MSPVTEHRSRRVSDRTIRQKSIDSIIQLAEFKFEGSQRGTATGDQSQRANLSDPRKDGGLLARFVVCCRVGTCMLSAPVGGRHRSFLALYCLGWSGIVFLSEVAILLRAASQRREAKAEMSANKES